MTTQADAPWLGIISGASHASLVPLGVLARAAPSIVIPRETPAYAGVTAEPTHTIVIPRETPAYAGVTAEPTHTIVIPRESAG